MIGGVLEAVCSSWRSKFKCAREHKKAHFSDRASEAMGFYDSPDDVVFGPGRTQKNWGFSVDENIQVPRIRVRVNKLFEATTLLMPMVMHRNPVRTVTPRKHRLPETVRQVMQAMGQPSPDSDPLIAAGLDARAWYMEQLENATPYELDLKGNSRHATVEAIVKGRGILWTELYRVGNQNMPGSTYKSVDDLLLDPDGQTVRECGWVALRRIQPVQDVEERFGLERGSLKGNTESLPLRSYYEDVDRQLGAVTTKSDWRSQDLIEYYEVFSRIGLGGRLFGAQNPLKDTIDAFGRHVYLAIAEGVNYPLNLPPNMEPDLPDLTEVKRRVSWPIPVYNDPAHPWPFAHLDFAVKPNSLWPVPWFWPSMGLLRMIAWMYSFMASHIQVATRQILYIPEDIQADQEEKLIHGGDFEVVKGRRDVPGNMEQVISFIEHPPVNRDYWEFLQAAIHEWERSTGISELLHGYVGGRQMRSAEEASIRSENTMLRPDDMADSVEDWQSLAARNEGIAWRLLCDPGDVAPIFGERYDISDPVVPQVGPYTGMYMQLLGSATPDEVLHEFDYRIASGSARKPNRAKMQQDIDESAQVLLPPLFQDYTQWGDPTMVNSWLRKWAETREFDPGLLQFPDRRPQLMAMQQMQMMQQMGAPPGQPPPEGMPEEEAAMAQGDPSQMVGPMGGM